MSKLTKHKSGYEHQHKARLKGTRRPARNMVPITARTRENYECWIVVINGEMVKKRMYAFPKGQIIVHVPQLQNNKLEVQQDEALGAAWRVKWKDIMPKLGRTTGD